jgi:hypothetical protein
MVADLIPAQGDPATLFERLRAHVAPFDPALVTRFQGASQAELDRYAALSGFGDDVPASYRSFALGMGRDNGGYLVDLRMDAKLPSIIELYEECEDSEYDSLSPDFPVAATYIVGDEVSFDRRTGVAEPPLVDSSDGELVRPLADSWESLVMQAAILRVEPRRLPDARWYSSSPASAAKALAGASARELVDDFAAKLSLPLAWPSDDLHRIAIDEHHSVFAKIGPKDSVLLYAFSTDEFFLRRVGSELAPALGASTGGILRIVGDALRDSKA